MLKAPRQLPPPSVLLADLGNPRPAVVGHALGVSVRTVYGWQAADACPRPAHLALFWESRWGRSALVADAVNGERVARGLADALGREVAALRARVAYLERVGSFGSANAPTITRPVSLLESPHAVALGLDGDGPALLAR